MSTPEKRRVAQAPPSREALRTAYELILTRILPRLPPTSQSTGRRCEHEDTTDRKRDHHADR
ncbi:MULTISPECIES: hypothetical protein [Brevibacillus]|uniref:hypothetical protein n=1 Tax=Brevibacillus TaxID=55080 RepID=UPI0011421998|nr:MULTISPECIES: hypothetical protein [Brevibacillus]MBU8714012.1 hypothetical protein [Brevibacillus parabrevis]MDH6350520.1 hypothetical protein [Brevibacillus sp. 1238]MDR4998425.1 hypothetical protein [Brevibacillus parabrevis]MED1722977.1 hypothetical protein [Brevibacillus parabrevis]MED2255571.1 hypothetical protein [Brevibacillus parabrevis]